MKNYKILKLEEPRNDLTIFIFIYIYININLYISKKEVTIWNSN
jgi:hypothetical protein